MFDAILRRSENKQGNRALSPTTTTAALSRGRITKVKTMSKPTNSRHVVATESDVAAKRIQTESKIALTNKPQGRVAQALVALGGPSGGEQRKAWARQNFAERAATKAGAHVFEPVTAAARKTAAMASFETKPESLTASLQAVIPNLANVGRKSDEVLRLEVERDRLADALTPGQKAYPRPDGIDKMAWNQLGPARQCARLQARHSEELDALEAKLESLDENHNFRTRVTENGQRAWIRKDKPQEVELRLAEAREETLLEYYEEVRLQIEDKGDAPGSYSQYKSCLEASKVLLENGYKPNLTFDAELGFELHEEGSLKYEKNVCTVVTKETDALKNSDYRNMLALAQRKLKSGC